MVEEYKCIIFFNQNFFLKCEKYYSGLAKQPSKYDFGMREVDTMTCLVHIIIGYIAVTF